MIVRVTGTLVLLASLSVLAIANYSFENSVVDKDRDKLWKQVEEANNKSLPKTAVEFLDQIYASALADQEYPEAVRALATKYSTLGAINQPIQPYVIRKLGEEVDELPEGVRPVMKVMLANWFFSYYQSNRWRFSQRSQTEVAPSDDFETWDLPRLLGEIDRLFTEALASAEQLQQIPIGEYSDLLTKGTEDDKYRPTLFDFVAFQALDFYSLDEQIVRKQGAFDVTADSPIFATADQFMKWEIDTKDEESFLLKAVKLYQDVLVFHEDDEDKTARIDADLHRFLFARQVAVGSETIPRFKAALERFAQAHADHPISSRALYSLAAAWQADDDLVKAHDLASQGDAQFPESVGGKLCFNLHKQISETSLQISSEQVFNSKSEISIQYRNLGRVHFRVFEFDYVNWEWGNVRSPGNLPKPRESLTKMKSVKQWSTDLPATPDYKVRTEAITPEFDLKSGCYLMVASTDPDYSARSNSIAMTDFWISDLAVMKRHEYGDLMLSAQVFDAESGQPVVGANVTISQWVRDGRNSRSVDMQGAQTDGNGVFDVEGAAQKIHRVIIRNGDQVFGYIDDNHKYLSSDRGSATGQTIFFTDRSIYRPGQTVNFKGVCISSDPDEGEYKTLTNRSVKISFRDLNNEEIEQRSFKTNEFGSFSGSFVAPRDRATGNMFIRVMSGPRGNANFRVEEYKRPKFVVEIEKLESQFKLNDTVNVNGSATAYTGAAIDGADVKWRVVRNVRYPVWWWYSWRGTNASEAQEIANGKAVTEVDGSFSIKFDAKPDLSVDPESEPVFVYSIYADVTDTTGETRSDQQTVRLGYTSMQAVIDCAEWQVKDEPIELELATSTLDGEGIAAEGTLKIHRLRGPDKVQRSRLGGGHSRYQHYASREHQNPNQISSWELGEVVKEVQWVTDATGKARQNFDLDAGAYKAVFETRDKAGRKVVAVKSMEVIDLAAGKFGIKVPDYFRLKDMSCEVGEEFVAVWGTGYEKGRAFVELENRGEVFRSFWTGEDNTQAVIRMQVPEQLRGGFNLRVTYVRENRAYVHQHRIDVPWSNKKLQVKWEHFVSKLKPGGKETWTAIISGPDADVRVAEMVATMYDASLDAYAPHHWPGHFNVFYGDHSQVYLNFANRQQSFRQIYHLRFPRKSASLQYRFFAPELCPSISYGFNGDQLMYGGQFRSRIMRRSRRGGRGEMMLGAVTERFQQSFADGSEDSVAMESAAAPMAAKVAESRAPSTEAEAGEVAVENTGGVDLSKVSARKNLNETAFFFPNLRVDGEGRVRIEFEVPEALTQWKIMGFAHDNELRTALLKDEAVTSKDLMVQPNPPRFLREGDELEFSVKVTNQSATVQSGQVKLSLANAQDETPMDAEFGNEDNEKTFEVPAGQSRSYYWKLKVPDFVGALTYKVVGATSKLSDGEEGLLPVLSKRILVTESLPLPIRGNQTRQFDFDRLKLAQSSDSLISQTYTVQMASNPSWYAVMALPYLMEYPHQCSEQVFNRLYANSIGGHIVNSDPKIRRIFDQWRATDALDSPLEKNEDLRNVLIAESPWLKDAKNESKARRDVAILFDSNRLSVETKRALEQLKQMQYSDGAWPWFPGGRANDYITLYVTTGFGRLRHLGVDVDVSPAIRSLDRLDNWIHETHQRILEKGNPELNHLTPSICLYVYGRSFFLKDQAVDRKYKAALDYFLGQAKEFWPKLSNRQSQGHLAIGLKRFGDISTPKEIMKSLTERSQTDDEMGMYWQEGERSWWWYRAPIETQALMIEAYDEVLGDREKAEECKIWLLKQKQTQNWKTTKATADAVYALLMRGTDLLASSKIVQVKLGGELVGPEKVEAGTGFYEKRFVRGEIKPEMGQIEVAKSDDGIAWGSVHWQYLEDVGKIEPYEGTPLTLKKGLFIKKNTDRGPVIEPVDGPVEVGDELVTRVEVRVDRDMEYVHLKDYRGSGTEPVNVLSRYKWQDGLSYYESTKDTASHFFIDYLKRGTYVFEYSVRVQHRGNYETGIAELQCMYAPEFNSHSASVEIEVK